MRKLFILTIFICSFMMSSLAHAEWTKVAESAINNDIYYVDFDRIRKHEGRVYYWSLVSHVKPKKYVIAWALSAKVYYEAECGRFRERLLEFAIHPDKMGWDRVIHRIDNPPRVWSYPSPNSVSERTLKIVCNYNP